MSAPWDDAFEDVLRAALPALAQRPLAADTCLKSARLDSMTTIEILLKLEDAYDVSFPDESLGSGTFATPGTLWSALSGIRQAAGGC
jgi:acyl carrier protein